MPRKPHDYKEYVATNRKAKFEYFILETFEAGMVLQGTEVKSLRNHSVNINDSYCDVQGGELVLLNAHINEYEKGTYSNHNPKRTRKLLLHRSQIRKLTGKLKEKGLTLVPLSLYFNYKNIAKIEIALVKGKKEYDKRETIKQEEWKRDRARMLKN